ncbi:MAG: cobalamin-dependent protein [Candidatus Riflebacteria bacterium]|nr:cobalamin-dependent protein [Candidatus Riflebacteria bacterium]
MMKLLLIDPPFKSFTGIFNFYFPLGLAYLAGCVKREGFECAILDMDAAEGKEGAFDFSHEYERYQAYIKALNDPQHRTWKLLRKLVKEQKPDYIGITAMTTKFGSVIQTARFCREELPNIPILIGGPHATTMPDLTLEIPQVDFVVRGEADETLPDLLKALKDKKEIVDMPGVSFKKGNKVFHNPPRPFVKNLDSIPFPDRGALLHPESYSSEDMGVMLTSRGCPYLCSYCFHMWERKVRFRSTENIINEIKQVKAKYGTPQFSFKDDSFTVKESHVLNLCEALDKEKLKIGWSCTTRVDLLKDSLLKIMKKSGCNVLSVGVESGSERILAETEKGITHSQIRSAARLLNENRIFWSGYFMIGLPTETEKDIEETLAFVGKVKPYYSGLGVYNPFPGTKLFDQGVKLGLLDPAPDLDHFLSTNPKDLFFKDPKKRMVSISGERFEEIAKNATEYFHKYNKNPSNMIRRGFARRKAYFQDFSLLKRDIAKALELIGIPI